MSYPNTPGEGIAIRDRSLTTVTAGGWSVSVTDPHSQDYVELSVIRWDWDMPNQWGGRGVSFPHEADGTRFPKVATATTRGVREAIEAAWDFAFAIGVIQYVGNGATE